MEDCNRAAFTLCSVYELTTPGNISHVQRHGGWCLLHCKNVTQETLTLISTQTIELERLSKEFWSQGCACTCSSVQGLGWICAGLEQIIKKLFTTCLLAKLYHPACSWRAFVISNNTRSLGPANSRFCRVFPKDIMRLRPANSAPEAEVLVMRRKADSYPWSLFWDSGSWLGAVVDPAAEGMRRMVNSSGGGIHFSRYKPLLCFLADEQCVVWHKLPHSSAFRMWN